MGASQFDTIYNVTSFGLACMMASTAFFFLRLPSMTERYKEALCYTGLVTFIAFYHYYRIFNSFDAAFTPCEVVEGVVNPNKCSPELGYSSTGHSFNDAYRYMDWLLTVPLLLIEIVLVMKLSPEETKKQSLRLGVLSGLMILNGDRARDEALPRRDQEAEPAPRRPLRPHDPQRVPRRELWRCLHPVDLLDSVHAPILLHRVHPLLRAQGVPGCSARGCPQPGQVGMLGHRDLVVHLPHRVHHANDVRLPDWQGWPHRWLHGRHPGRIHRV